MSNTAVTPAFPTKQMRDEFFVDLRALLAKYPCIANRMTRDYEVDPTNENWDEERGYPGFNPESPMFLQGVVVVVSHANMENYEDIVLLEPYEQPRMLTIGMLAKTNFMGLAD